MGRDGGLHPWRWYRAGRDGQAARGLYSLGVNADPEAEEEPVSRPLDVLIVVHNPTRQGGAYFRARGLAKPLIRRGHRVQVMAIHPTERWRMGTRELDGSEVVESPDLLPGFGRSGWDPWDTLRRTLWIRRRHFDVIHTVDTRPAVSIPAFLGRKAAGAVWIADWTDWWGRGGATEERKNKRVNVVLGPLEQFFEEKPRPRADGTVVISRALGRRAAGLGIPADRQLLLPPGADPDDVRDTAPGDARRALGLPVEGNLLGYLGNIYPRDADLLFDAMRQLREPATLLLVGESGVEVPGDLGDRVRALGRLPFGEMLDHLSACDVLVLPMTDSVANRGRWPSKINEYVAVGRPTVVCDVGDVADLVGDHDIGVVVAPRPAELAGGIDELLGDSDRAAAMGKRARELALHEYSQDAVAEKLEAYYLKVIDGLAGDAPASRGET
jgi:glycosyltransferase involved in cell wall biosynthesis